MTKRLINLSGLKPIGKSNIKIIDNVAEAWTTRSISTLGFHLANDEYRRHFIALPGKYRLPLRVDMEIKLDYPAFVLLVGGGHVYFASGHDDFNKAREFFRHLNSFIEGKLASGDPPPEKIILLK